MAKDLFSELQRLQHMLDGSSGSPSKISAAYPPGPSRHHALASEDSEEAGASIQAGIAAALRGQLGQAQAEARSLRKQLAAAEREAEESRNHAGAVRREGESVAAGLRAQLAARAREADELAGALRAARDEAQALRDALDRHMTWEVATGEEEALQRAAEEERRHADADVAAAALAAAREEATALRAANRELRAQLEATQAALEEERAGRSRAELRQAVLAVAAEGPRQAQRGAEAQVGACADALMRDQQLFCSQFMLDAIPLPAPASLQLAALKTRLALERQWRKATHAWLAGEAHAKSELERLMVSWVQARRCSADAVDFPLRWSVPASAYGFLSRMVVHTALCLCSSTCRRLLRPVRCPTAH